MTATALLSPPNSLLLVLDPASGVLPDTLGGSSIVASSSSLVVGTQAEFDGETKVTLAGSGTAPSDSALALRWEGALETSGRIAVVTIYNEVVIESSAPQIAHVQVWTNHPEEPDVIWVAIA